MQKHEVIPHDLVRDENFPYYISGELISTEHLELGSAVSDESEEVSNDNEISPDSIDAPPHKQLTFCNRIFNIYEPVLYGLSFNSYPDLVYTQLEGIPGTGSNMNIPYLAYSIVVPPFFAVLKLLEKTFNFRPLVALNRILSGLDAFPSSYVFNLTMVSAIWQMVESQLNGNQYTESDISDWSFALYNLALATPSFFVTLASLGIYQYLENKFSHKRLSSGFFKLCDITAFFLENAVKLNAIGKMSIRFTTVFSLGGTTVEENPAKWFWTEVFPSIAGSTAVGALLTYVAYRKNPLPLLGLGNQKHRYHLIERQRMIWTVIAINGYYWANVYLMWQDPEGTKSEDTLIYLSGITTILLLLIPSLVTSGLILYQTASICSNIKDFFFEFLSKEPKLKFTESSHNNIEQLNSDSVLEPLIKTASSDCEIETLSSTSSDSESEIIDVSSNQGYFRFPRIPSWLSIFGSRQSQGISSKTEEPKIKLSAVA
jgi:hypothetical protein